MKELTRQSSIAKAQFIVATGDFAAHGQHSSSSAIIQLEAVASALSNMTSKFRFFKKSKQNNQKKTTENKNENKATIFILFSKKNLINKSKCFFFHFRIANYSRFDFFKKKN